MLLIHFFLIFLQQVGQLLSLLFRPLSPLCWDVPQPSTKPIFSLPVYYHEPMIHSSYDIFLLKITSIHFLSCSLLSLLCLLDIGKHLLTLRSPWIPQCRGLVLALFFHTHFILSILPPNTVALQSSTRSQGHIFQSHSFIRHPLCSLEAMGQASLLPISAFAIRWCFVLFFPNTFPDNSCYFQDILENMHCVQIPNCKWISPECHIMAHGWLPNHWLAVMLQAPWHIFLAKVHYF